MTQSDVNEAEVEKDSQVTPESIGTPQSSKFLDIASDTSPATSMISASSTATPSMPRGRGRPRKILTKPDFSDFPVGGSYEEQECWFKAKKTNMWWYNILTSDQEAAYHARENQRTSKYYHDKRGVGSDGRGRAQRATSTVSRPNLENDNLDGIELLDVDNTNCTQAQELSRQR